METQETIIKADVGLIIDRKKKKSVFKIFYGLLIASFIIGLLSHPDKFYDMNLDRPVVRIGWFNKNIWTRYPIWFGEYLEDRDPGHFDVYNTLTVMLPYIILASIPIIAIMLLKKMSKNTTLVVAENQICGSYNSFIFKKTLQMPIEKVDNLTVSSTFSDKIRTGKTLAISSGASIIKLHFVQNADEVVSAAMEQIMKKKA